MSVFVSAGEASGDHYIAAAARSLARRLGVRIWGMGGRQSREAGVDAVWPAERLQLFGLTEVIGSIPMLFRLRDDMALRILDERPQAVVVCDSPDFHLRLLALLRRKGYGGRVFYISPPSVWAWRRGRVKLLRRYVDECLPLFGFEHDYLCSHGCLSHWRAHPMAEEFRAAEDIPQDALKYSGCVAFLPGSRRSEIGHLLPEMRLAARMLEDRGYKTVFSVAPGLAPDVRAAMIREFTESGTAFYEGEGRDLLRIASCAVAACGTVTLEALLAGCYTVAVYRLSAVTALAGRALVRTKFYSPPNILSGTELFPELMQGRATAANMASAVLEWLDERNRDLRAEKAGLMSKARAMLGSGSAYDLWCERITESGL